jgi:hypothetical protein
MRNFGQTYDPDVPIHSRYSLVGARFQQFAGDDFLHSEHYSVFASDANSGTTVLDRFHCIFDLETISYFSNSNSPTNCWEQKLRQGVRTWKFRPSGEKTEFERSYPVPIDVYVEGSISINLIED